jgi:phospholipase C
VNRRGFLKLAGAAGLGAATFPLRSRADGPLPSLPALTPAVDNIPQIQHFVLVVMENHSFDNVLGSLARPGIDGLTFDAHGVAQNSNPDTAGQPVFAYHLPTTCQDNNHVGQSWDSSHRSWNAGANDGFVKVSGKEAMGFYSAADLPVMHALGSTYPVCNRWFCSTMCQTYPNRMFTFAGTSQGAIATDTTERVGASAPPAGTIFDSLTRAGVSWKNYAVDLGDTMLWGPAYFASVAPGHFFPIANFYADAASGLLPAFSVITPDAFEASEENPQNVVAGETFLWSVVTALFASPAWGSTALLITYDEHGGYYDHVPPVALPKPDESSPELAKYGLTDDYGDDFTWSGFRVPTILVSPWARANYVSNTSYEHTSIMKFLEYKYGLQPLTKRDGAAVLGNMTDLFDFGVAPAFPDPLLLPPPPLAESELACLQRNETGISTP